MNSRYTTAFRAASSTTGTGTATINPLGNSLGITGTGSTTTYGTANTIGVTNAAYLITRQFAAIRWNTPQKKSTTAPE